MSGPVDVLAVIESAAVEMYNAGFIVLPTKLVATHAAVAELIEANKELAEANADPRHTLGRDLRVLNAETRLRAALTNVGGAK